MLIISGDDDAEHGQLGQSAGASWPSAACGAIVRHRPRAARRLSRWQLPFHPSWFHFQGSRAAKQQLAPIAWLSTVGEAAARGLGHGMVE